MVYLQLVDLPREQDVFIISNTTSPGKNKPLHHFQNVGKAIEDNHITDISTGFLRRKAISSLLRLVHKHGIVISCLNFSSYFAFSFSAPAKRH